MTNKMHMAGDNRPDPGDMGKSKGIQSEGDGGGDPWLTLATDAFTESESYFETNIRRPIERNLAHFGNRHAPGSKYYSPQFRHRHKGFRPKTRAMVRKNESALAKAMFSTADVVHVKAERDNDPQQVVSAEVNKALLQYRLENTIPWFMTVQGAFQDSLVTGPVISYQYWDFDELVEEVSSFDEEGNEDFEEHRTIIKDTPAIDLRPLENVFFSVAADWRDPVNTSPFLIDKIPMTVDAVKRMAKPQQKSQIPWFELTDAELMKGKTTDQDAIRQAREGKREDSKDQQYVHKGFDTVWVHRNLIKQDGLDMVFYTLGTHHRLSDPIPVEIEYPHLRPGERPYVIGTSNIETHKNYPESTVGLAAGVQQSANEINNQRFDNVQQVLNRRYYTNRNASIDNGALIRNVPGSVVEMDDPRNDIRIDAPPDVTASSYQEQDRINQDFDELTGSFNATSVAANRGMKDPTLGSMELLSEDSDDMTEYQLMIFVETWVEPVLKQILRLEQRHESDPALLATIAQKVKLWDKMQTNEITDMMIQGNMNVRVNVGFGATNPQQHLNKLSLGLSTMGTYLPNMMARADEDEIAKEIWGALGVRGIERFFPPMQEGEQLPGPQPEPMTEFERAKLEMEQKLQSGKFKDAEEERALKWALSQNERDIKMMQMSSTENISIQKISAELEKSASVRQSAVDEMRMKMLTGKSGI